MDPERIHKQPFPHAMGRTGSPGMGLCRHCGHHAPPYTCWRHQRAFSAHGIQHSGQPDHVQLRPRLDEVLRVPLPETTGLQFEHRSHDQPGIKHSRNVGLHRATRLGLRTFVARRRPAEIGQVRFVRQKLTLTNFSAWFRFHSRSLSKEVRLFPGNVSTGQASRIARRSFFFSQIIPIEKNIGNKKRIYEKGCKLNDILKRVRAMPRFSEIFWNTRSV